jgi:hypothetical protein
MRRHMRTVETIAESFWQLIPPEDEETRLTGRAFFKNEFVDSCECPNLPLALLEAMRAEFPNLVVVGEPIVHIVIPFCEDTISDGE